MIYAHLFWAFFKVGVFGFGGGMAIIGLIYENIKVLVPIDQYQFADIVAISQTTPGPVAVNAATYIGYLTSGFLGSFIATLGVCIPAFVIVYVVAKLIEKHNGNEYILGAINGVKPATVAMVAAAAITLSKPAFLTEKVLGTNLGQLHAVLPGRVDIIAIMICAITVVAIGKYKLSPIKVMIVMGIVGALLGV